MKIFFKHFHTFIIFFDLTGKKRMTMSILSNKVITCIFSLSLVIFLIGIVCIITVGGLEYSIENPVTLPNTTNESVDTNLPYYHDYMIRRSVTGPVLDTEDKINPFLNLSYDGREKLTGLLPERYYYPDGPVIGQGFNFQGEITVHILEGCKISNETMDEIEQIIRTGTQNPGVEYSPIVFYYDIMPVLD